VVHRDQVDLLEHQDLVVQVELPVQVVMMVQIAVDGCLTAL